MLQRIPYLFFVLRLPTPGVSCDTIGHPQGILVRYWKPPSHVYNFLIFLKTQSAQVSLYVKFFLDFFNIRDILSCNQTGP